MSHVVWMTADRRQAQRLTLVASARARNAPATFAPRPRERAGRYNDDDRRLYGMIRRALLVAIAACSVVTPSSPADHAERPEPGSHDRAPAGHDTRAPRATRGEPVADDGVGRTAVDPPADRASRHRGAPRRARRTMATGAPSRPSQWTAAGWIRATSVRLVRSPWRLVVSRAQRQARLLDGGRLVEVIPVVVGAPSTPTPRGQFFVAEHVRQTVARRSGSGRSRRAPTRTFSRNSTVGRDRSPSTGGVGRSRSPRWDRQRRTAASGSTTT